MFLGLNRNRLMTHVGLALLTVASVGLTFPYAPSASLGEVLSIGTGYEALLLLIITLLIGPFNLLRKRRNPVNLDLRRDTGIWSGFTALIHVVFSFQLYENGDILSYFFNKTPGGYTARLDLFSFSNIIGLIATLVLLVLLITSNQLSLRWLKGKRWKYIQRFNYPLFGLVLVHTFGYQVLNVREGIFAYSTIALSLFVLVAQLAGIATMRRRSQQRAIETGPVAASVVSAPPLPVRPELARRQFLIAGGAILLGGFAGGAVFGRVLNAQNEGGLAAPVAAQLPTATQTALPPSATLAATSAAATTQPAQTSAAATTTQASSKASVAPTAGATQAAATSRSLILATTASLAPGNALKFTTPDTKESAFLVREADGSVKAFSGICTHRPYNLVFSSSQQALVCNLHNVPFNIKNGAPLSRPASTALASFKVQTDSQSNIVYVQS